MAFGNNQHLDWKLLRDYGLEEWIHERLNVAPWVKLFEINKPTYRDINIEFLSTMKLTDGWLTFQAYGRRCNIPISNISLYLGLETPAESMSHQFLPAPTAWPVNMNPQLF